MTKAERASEKRPREWREAQSANAPKGPGNKPLERTKLGKERERGREGEREKRKREKRQTGLRWVCEGSRESVQAWPNGEIQLEFSGPSLLNCVCQGYR